MSRMNQLLCVSYEKDILHITIILDSWIAGIVFNGWNSLQKNKEERIPGPLQTLVHKNEENLEIVQR